MPFTEENELAVREDLAATIATIPQAGFVIPAPLYVTGQEDFFATLDPTINTREEIDKTLIAATWIYPLRFEDNTETDPDHSPLIELTYGIYLFRQYALERADETDTPDDFGKTVLDAHNTFTAAWLAIKAAFQGRRNMAGFDAAVFASVRTTSVVQIEDIENQAECEFVPGIVGFAVTLEETINLKLREC